MFSLDRLLSIDAAEIPEVSKKIDNEEIKQLVDGYLKKTTK
ncbi:MAG TPA: hypothetical protein PKW03_00045 [Acetivibrio sp.]|nr:hypothetical protein [Acetivibrio sp.]HPT89928.1 hypothetical protein [Acetivibrio sp.]